MLVCDLGVADLFRRGQVARYAVGELTGKRSQLGAYARVELVGGDVSRNLRSGDGRRARGNGFGSPPVLPRRRGAAALAVAALAGGTPAFAVAAGRTAVLALAVLVVMVLAVAAGGTAVLAVAALTRTASDTAAGDTAARGTARAAASTGGSRLRLAPAFLAPVARGLTAAGGTPSSPVVIHVFSIDQGMRRPAILADGVAA